MKYFSFLFVIVSLNLIACKGSKETNSNQITSEVFTDSVIAAVESYDKEMKLEGTKWKLLQLRGKQVQNTSERELLIEFHEDGRFSANMGCNGIGGNYHIKEGNRITFSQVISTMMACPNMENEEIFKSIIETIDNYTISNNKLSLNKARMAPLAVFIKK